MCIPCKFWLVYLKLIWHKFFSSDKHLTQCWQIWHNEVQDEESLIRFSIGSSGRGGGVKKHEFYVAAFGGHLFHDLYLFLQGLGGGGMVPSDSRIRYCRLAFKLQFTNRTEAVCPSKDTMYIFHAQY